MKAAVPSNFVPIFKADEIAKRTEELGQQIGEWASEVQSRTSTDVLTVPLLRGAIFFFSDLVRKIGTSVEVAPVRTWGYDPEKNQIDKTLKVNLDGVAAERRSILLVDDICDSGRSLCAVSRAFLDAGAYEVKSAVLIQRLIPEAMHVPDWIGFKYEKDLWFVG
ncbi:MAG: hypothetical protein GYA55_12560, partial [SAR324 cluster bacterium]|nr:hypothetical protein [SAR324 cluster bacterium]